MIPHHHTAQEDTATVKLKAILVTAAAILLGFLPADVTAAGPLISADYFGPVYVNGQPAPPGTRIDAYASSGLSCGTFHVTRTGVFGFLSCTQSTHISSENTTVTTPTEGEEIHFKVNGKDAIAVGNNSWIPGAQLKIKLVYDRREIAAISELADPAVSEQRRLQSTIIFGMLAVGILAAAILGGLFLIKRTRGKI